MAIPRFTAVTRASTLARRSVVVSAAALTLSGCTSSSGPGPAASSAQLPVSAASADPGPGLTSATGSSSRTSLRGGGPKPSTPRSTGTPTSINGGSGSGGSDGHPPGTAVTAFQAWTADWNAGRYRDMWSALPPEQRGQVSAHAFAACEKDQALQVGATGVVYRRTVRQRTTTMATAGSVHTVGVAITAAIYFDARDPVTSKLTLFWYADGRAWRWLLDDSSLHAYRNGSCPS